MQMGGKKNSLHKKSGRMVILIHYKHQSTYVRPHFCSNILTTKIITTYTLIKQTKKK